MSTPIEIPFDPRYDLRLEREADVSPPLVWAAWTQPEHLVHWFCPKPWQVTACEIDLRPGGRFRTVMRGPDGTEMDNTGCYLEIVPNVRLVWTNALAPGFRPAPVSDSAAPMQFSFTAIIEMHPIAAGTRYVATVLHRSEADRATHDAMGFSAGWSTALDQLVAHMKASASAPSG